MIKLSIDTLRRLIRSHFPQDKYVWKMKKADCLKRLEPYEIKGNGRAVRRRTATRTAAQAANVLET